MHDRDMPWPWHSVAFYEPAPRPASFVHSPDRRLVSFAALPSQNGRPRGPPSGCEWLPAPAMLNRGPIANLVPGPTCTIHSQPWLRVGWRRAVLDPRVQRAHHSNLHD
ncbi:hypothetical protein BD289DRAFT_448032 [Coniella lustricola]|uniref:Uncharacterized protein n=1 Tax=Coniella lustricola TaxID=2025994 RepID=A0A2T2ZSJ8_9PEZI|nr:hypothetical protein BD289DRAFT_448032 [Coniella lustricola]